MRLTNIVLLNMWRLLQYSKFASSGETMNEHVTAVSKQVSTHNKIG